LGKLIVRLVRILDPEIDSLLLISAQPPVSWHRR
jgi:hypothetical protein